MSPWELLEPVIRAQSPHIDAFYNKLGDSQQNMLTEMLVTDPALAEALKKLAPAEGAPAGQNFLDQIPPGVLNTLMEEAYNDTAFRKTLTESLNDPARVMAAIAAEQAKDNGFAQKMAAAYAAPADAAPAPADVTPADPNNPLSKLGGILQSFMGGNFMQGFNQVFEMIFGKSLTDLFKSMEVLTQSGGPNNLGDMLKTLLSPTAQVHEVDPQTGLHRTVRTADLGNDPPVREAMADLDMKHKSMSMTT